jgi:hypothetical protein
MPLDPALSAIAPRYGAAKVAERRHARKAGKFAGGGKFVVRSSNG